MPNPIKLTWEECKQEFEFDGTWRDIYVLDTSDRDWNKFLQALLNSQYQVDVWIDSEPAKPIKTIQEGLELMLSRLKLMYDKSLFLKLDSRELS